MEVDAVARKVELCYPEEDGWVIDYPTSEEIYRRMEEQETNSVKKTKSK